jgi:ERCC4-related helicase
MPANDEVLLLALPPGIGKSRAAQTLVGYALEHDHDLVIYVAPTRGIIDEIEVVRRPRRSRSSPQPEAGSALRCR